MRFLTSSPYKHAMAVILALSGFNSEDILNEIDAQADQEYSIAGTIQDLDFNSALLLQNNGETLKAQGNGTYKFVQKVVHQSPYAVRIQRISVGCNCDRMNGDGIVNGESINKFAVQCEPLSDVRNPVLAEDFSDPTVLVEPGGDIFANATKGKIIKSRNLAQWENVGDYIGTSGWRCGTKDAGVWTTDIAKVNGEYHLYYSLPTRGDPNPGIQLAVAQNPAGPWNDLGKLFNSKDIQVNNSIDPFYFKSKDNQLFMPWGGFRGIYAVALGATKGLLNPSSASTSKTLLAGYQTSAPFDINTYQGAYIKYRRGYYYLFLSTGTCCEVEKSTYKVVVGRSTSPLGPYNDHASRGMRSGLVGSLVIAGDNKTVVGPGHNAVLKDTNCEWWMLYHGYPQFNPLIGRALYVDRLLWTADGWSFVLNKSTSEFPFRS